LPDPGPLDKLRAATGLDLQRLVERVGAPTLIAVLILSQLEPKIDRGIQIADHVDAELQYLAVRGCAPLSPAVFVQSVSPQLDP